MTLEIGKKYILRFQVNEKELVYTATIISIANNFIEFVDKYNHFLGYSIEKLISYEEVEDD